MKGSYVDIVQCSLCGVCVVPVWCTVWGNPPESVLRKLFATEVAIEPSSLRD